jgi:hypothetical protein
LVTDFVADPADQLRVDAAAGRIALGDDLAVVEDHDRLGRALRCAVGLREGAVERGLENRVRRLDHLGTGNRRQQGRCGRTGRDLLGGRRRIVQDQAAQGAAIHGVAFGEAGKACRHLTLLAVDLVAQQEFDGLHGGRDGLAVEGLGLDLAHEGGRTELMAGEARRHAGGALQAVAGRQQGDGAAQQQQHGN